MTLAERLRKFEDRGFKAETAAILVLIEEALHSLFATFPDTLAFWWGDSRLVLWESEAFRGHRPLTEL